MQATFLRLTTRAKPFLPGTDVGLALGIIALLAVLVVPLPSALLDVGLALSVTASVLVLSATVVVLGSEAVLALAGSLAVMMLLAVNRPAIDLVAREFTA